MVAASTSEVIGDKDMHLISGEDLDKLFSGSKEMGIFHHLLFMLLITTGMRIGGAASILLADIGSWKGGEFVVATQGHTIEKGHKKFSFAISARVADYIGRYIKTTRPMTNLGHLFITPRGSNYSSNNLSTVFKRIKEHCGLALKDNIHAHAMRHSFAHILIENGNDAYTVSRMMGHSSVQTTEKFYLKETAAEVAGRANVPWLNKETDRTRERKTPEFMGRIVEKESKVYNKVTQDLRRKLRDAESYLC